jgi:hypothetical protein
MKKIFLILALITLCFVVVACDENNNKPTPINTDKSIPTNAPIVNTTKEPEETITSNENQFVFSIGEGVTTIYTLSGDVVTGHKDIVEYETEELAKSAVEQFNNEKGEDSNVDSVTAQGNILTVIYNDKEYSKYTLETLRSEFGE